MTNLILVSEYLKLEKKRNKNDRGGGVVRSVIYIKARKLMVS